MPKYVLNGIIRNALVLFAALVLSSGCATRALMPTPNLYTSGMAPLYAELAPELQGNQVSLVYVTDRAPEKDEAGRLRYGYRRSLSTAFGIVRISIGDTGEWEDLLKASAARDRARHLPLTVADITELGRFPPTPYPLTVKDGVVVSEPATVARSERTAAQFRELVRARLALTPRKEVFIYVHGYNNDFDEAAFTLAELWHFLGREGVPIVYTWPAGFGGPRGYAVDRESGEFTVYHFKQLLRTLASIDEVQRVSLVAHSRGTDVALSALRELILDSRAAGRDPRRAFRIANLVLAAPDLDLEVISQRVVAERVGDGVGRLTIYTSREDKALAAAAALFGSALRLGRLQAQDVKPDIGRSLTNVGNIDFVEHRGSADFFGHGYFHSNPAASSDLILRLRFDREPGVENERPLRSAGPRLWFLTDEYPENGGKASTAPPESAGSASGR